MESWWNDSIRGYGSAWEETCPGHILHHKSHIDIMSKPGLRGNRPATNLLNHGADSKGQYYFDLHLQIQCVPRSNTRLGYIHQELSTVCGNKRR